MTNYTTEIFIGENKLIKLQTYRFVIRFQVLGVQK